jgi:hypothetical protein
MMRALLMLLFITVVAAACKKDVGINLDSKSYKVQYSIGCTNCMVVYVADTLGTQQTEYSQNSNWTYSFFGKKGQEILLLAYNTSDLPQGINVKIAINDSTTKDKTTYCAISGVSFATDTIR